MDQNPPWSHCRQRARSRIHFLQVAATPQIAKHRRRDCEGHEETESPVLRFAHHRAEALRGLRAGEIHEKIKKGLFEQQHAADHGDTGAESEANAR
jgi:hypothetical protein